MRVEGYQSDQPAPDRHATLCGLIQGHPKGMSLAALESSDWAGQYRISPSSNEAQASRGLGGRKGRAGANVHGKVHGMARAGPWACCAALIPWTGGAIELSH